MANGIPRFEHPPIVELVLGVQFAPLANFTNGHLGWFWKRYLEEDWLRPADAVPIVDQFETFADQRRWGAPDFRLTVGPVASPTRLQIRNATGDRMLQVQPTRFHYNWLKKDQAYPTYGKLRGSFAEYFARFSRFVAEAGLGEIAPNQWEITYVDQISRRDLWQSPADWHKVLPGLLAPGPDIEGAGLESVGGEWHYEIKPRKGRLHVCVQYGKPAAEGEPTLMLHTTARGPIGKDSGLDLSAGLDLGHAVALRAFLKLTSADAQRVWGRVDR